MASSRRRFLLHGAAIAVGATGIAAMARDRRTAGPGYRRELLSASEFRRRPDEVGDLVLELERLTGGPVRAQRNLLGFVAAGRDRQVPLRLII